VFIFSNFDEDFTDVLASRHEAESFFSFVASKDAGVEWLDDTIIDALFEKAGYFEPIFTISNGLIHHGIEEDTMEGCVFEHVGHSEAGVLSKIDFSNFEEAAMLS
jgi:hypothetical protein